MKNDNEEIKIEVTEDIIKQMTKNIRQSIKASFLVILKYSATKYKKTENDVIKLKGLLNTLTNLSKTFKETSNLVKGDKDYDKAYVDFTVLWGIYNDSILPQIIGLELKWGEGDKKDG